MRLTILILFLSIFIHSTAQRRQLGLTGGLMNAAFDRGDVYSGSLVPGGIGWNRGMFYSSSFSQSEKFGYQLEATYFNSLQNSNDVDFLQFAGLLTYQLSPKFSLQFGPLLSKKIGDVVIHSGDDAFPRANDPHFNVLLGLEYQILKNVYANVRLGPELLEYDGYSNSSLAFHSINFAYKIDLKAKDTDKTSRSSDRLLVPGLSLGYSNLWGISASAFSAVRLSDSFHLQPELSINYTSSTDTKVIRPMLVTKIKIVNRLMAQTGVAYAILDGRKTNYLEEANWVSGMIGGSYYLSETFSIDARYFRSIWKGEINDDIKFKESNTTFSASFYF